MLHRLSMVCVLTTAAYLATLAAPPPAFALEARRDRIDFNRDVRPIISDRCFACHGPDAAHAKGGLRLDIAESAYAKKKSGDIAIVPGKPEASALVARIYTDDADDIMPPPDSHKSLSAGEKATLKQWIAEGGSYQKPWAYVPPVAAPVPQVKRADWPINFIDRFILARLEAERLAPSPDADRVTLIRRVTFDLTGLPPTPAEVDAFIADTSADAYEKLVDRLLASPHFGERMAIWWLDLVRYADTVGYHGDQDHNAWPYRDYVIGAFNSGMPLDRFMREQLAGDLLPDPTQDQLVATCYNRLLQTTHEGGAQLKEYRAIYMADRVRNVSQVFMGATVGCAQCHSHKYDPYTAEDFHTLGAFFADVDDEEHLRNQYGNLNTLPTRRLAQMKVYTPAEQKRLGEIAADLASLAEKAGPIEAELKKQDQLVAAMDKQIKADKSPDSKKLHEDQLAKLKEQRQQIADRLAVVQKPIKGLTDEQAKITKTAPEVMYTSALKEPRPVHLLPRGNWLDETGPLVTPAIPAFMGKLPTAGGGDRRATRLDLANWLVAPDTDGGVGGLTARVQVNRLWALVMGVGIARVLDDFGGQGEPPVHPELLDRLAIALVDSGWDVKATLKLIVMSRTYRQSSVTPAALAERDPDNRLYARQSRPRLPAEMVRDNALAISGLLVDDLIGGPSVKPYQPPGYYAHLNFPKREYKVDGGPAQWRRGLYVHWQRQFLHPMLKAFDAQTREECVAGRPQSNIPTQALTLLNDPTFVEASRVFAARVLAQGGAADGDRIVLAFKIATSRAPELREIAALGDLLEKHRSHFTQHPDEAAKLLKVGLTPAPPGIEPPELAAWTSVCRTLLNLNETITRN